jgi:hypothetical protein
MLRLSGRKASAFATRKVPILADAMTRELSTSVSCSACQTRGDRRNGFTGEAERHKLPLERALRALENLHKSLNEFAKADSVAGNAELKAEAENIRAKGQEAAQAEPRTGYLWDRNFSKKISAQQGLPLRQMWLSGSHTRQLLTVVREALQLNQFGKADVASATYPHALRRIY